MTISSALVAWGVSPNLQNTVKGAVIIVAVLFQYKKGSRENKKCLLIGGGAADLCGCGTIPEKKKLRIGISVPSATHGWTGGVVWSAERAEKSIEAANPDVDVMIATSANTAAQVDAIENLLMQNIDALVVLSQEPEPLDNVCRQAKTRGVYLVVVSNPLPSGAQDVFVNGDNASFGAAAGEAMGQALNGKGDILVLEGFLCPINTERVESFKKVLADKYPGIRIP